MFKLSSITKTGTGNLKSCFKYNLIYGKKLSFVHFEFEHVTVQNEYFNRYIFFFFS